MQTITIEEFERDLDKYIDSHVLYPIGITENGKVKWVLMDAKDFVDKNPES